MAHAEVIQIRINNYCQWCWMKMISTDPGKSDTCSLTRQPLEYSCTTDKCKFSHLRPDLENAKKIVMEANRRGQAKENATQQPGLAETKQREYSKDIKKCLKFLNEL